MKLNFWPFTSEIKPKEKFNVGISCATISMVAGDQITVTRKGRANYGFLYISKYKLEEAMQAAWVFADDGIYYNRAHMLSYFVTHTDYFVEGGEWVVG